LTHDGAGGLRHAFDQVHAGKHGPRRGKWPENWGSLYRDVLDADAGHVAVDLDDLIDQQKRIAVGQAMISDVGHTQRRIGHRLVSPARASRRFIDCF
jgi:hypothetical protein